jgi:hypothetical protein
MENLIEEIKNIEFKKAELRNELNICNEAEKQLKIMLFKKCNHEWVKEQCLYGETYCKHCLLTPSYKYIK